MERDDDAPRDPFLDGLRAVALLRVVVWHAFGAAAITYVLAAVPTMMAVTGSLLERSLSRRPAREVIPARLRRLLVPYWAYAATVLVISAIGGAVLAGAERLPPEAVLAWVLPVLDPVGPAWQQGWLSSALWYVRIVLWLLVLATPIRWLVHRAPRVTLAVAAAGVGAADLVARVTEGAPRTVAWYLGGLCLHGGFLAFGMLHGAGRLHAVGRGRWAMVALLATVATVAWVSTQPVPDMVANDSHPAHALVGVAWLALAFACEPRLRALACRPLVAAAVRTVNRRSLTIYLWHSLAVVGAYRIVSSLGADLPWGARPVLVLAGTALITAALVGVFGPLEDRAAGRRSERRAPATVRPRRVVPVFGGALTAVAFLAPVVRPVDVAMPQRSPSQQPTAPVWREVTAGTGPAAPAVGSVGVGPLPVDALQRVLERFRVANGLDWAAVGVERADGARWHSVAEAGTGGQARTEQLSIMSVTKSFTAALVWQEVEAGRLDVDGPLPVLDGVDPAAVTGLTPRLLLEHRSGLVSYWDLGVDLGQVAGPRELVRLVLAADRLFPPGEGASYSTSNFLVLGVLLEQVTGTPYAELLRARILEPLALEGTRLEQPGNPREAAGSLVSSISDLLTWGGALFRDRGVVRPDSLAEMTAADPVSTYGAGLQAYCPCRMVGGSAVFSAHGSSGDTTRLMHVTDFDVVVVIEVPRSQWDGSGIYDAMSALAWTIAAVAAGGGAVDGVTAADASPGAELDPIDSQIVALAAAATA